MTNTFIAGIIAALQTITISMVIFLLQKRNNKKEEEREKKEEARRKESLLELEMVMANNKLSYAVAMAIKRGTPNGEVEEGIKAYNEAYEHYMTFIETQVKNYLD